MPTKINYVDETWNPVIGCTKISLGCKNCYAETIAKRFWGGRPFTDVQCHPERLNIPIDWRKPRRILVPSMGDLFHDKVPFEFIGKVFEVMCKCQQHTFLVLTKRVNRMFDLYMRYGGTKHLEAALHRTGQETPIPNVYLGVSVCNQAEADEKIPILLQIPAAHRWVSFEPLLGKIDIPEILPGHYWYDWEKGCLIDYAVIGCESGPGRRPCKREWIKSLYDQCRAAGVEVMVKQMEIDGKVCHDHAKCERLIADGKRDIEPEIEY